MQSFDEWLIGRLRLHGAYGGRMDGAHGREVIAALSRFQKAEGLDPSGQADAATIDRLRRAARGAVQATPAAPDDMPDAAGEPVWMREAGRFMGLKEITGPTSSPIILGWAKALGGWVARFYREDDTPGCGLFIGHVIAATLPREALPANPLSALSWSSFGMALDQPAPSAILTFTRKGGGHVGIYAGEDAMHFFVLGGNQDNRVPITRIAKTRLAAIRWPKTGEPPEGGRVRPTASHMPVSHVPASRNEA